VLPEPQPRVVAAWIAGVLSLGLALVLLDPHPKPHSTLTAAPTAQPTTTAPTTTAPADLASLLVDLESSGYSLAPSFPMPLDLEAVAAGRTPDGTDLRRQELVSDGFVRAVSAVWSADDRKTTAAARIYEFDSEAGADRFFRFDKRNAVFSATRTFPVTTVPSSFGYGYDETRTSGGTYPVQQVIFAKGTRVFVVRVNGLERPVDPQEAITIAERQFAAG
jgi:hypothetical protein